MSRATVGESAIYLSQFALMRTFSGYGVSKLDKTTGDLECNYD